MVLNAEEKGKAKQAQVVLAHVRNHLRMTATLDSKKDIIIDFNQATEKINAVLSQYDKNEGHIGLCNVNRHHRISTTSFQTDKDTGQDIA